MRINFDPDQTDPSTIYALINSAVVPRPIAWVSTTSAAGIDNLAPHSYFNVASVRPPMLLFVSLGRKDTLRNIETTGQFVVNVAPEAAFEIVNATSTEYPESVSGFDLIGVEREASTAVEPPRVAASPVAFECLLHNLVSFGHSTVVFGRVVHIAIDRRVMQDGLPDIEKLKPLARLGQDDWSTIGKVLTIPRVKYEDWRASDADL